MEFSKVEFTSVDQLTFYDDGLCGGGSEGNGIFVAAFRAESIGLIHLPREGSEGWQQQVQGGVHADTEAPQPSSK